MEKSSATITATNSKYFYLAVTGLVIVPVKRTKSCAGESCSFTEYVGCAKARVAPE